MFWDYLEKIKKTLGVTVLYAVLYARYSSDMQRSESIDAQIRAITAFAQQHGIIILKEYIDEAQSAKYDNREAFQQMFKDASKTTAWQIVLVHKLDRFARNRDDSRHYRVKLRMSKKYLISVTEQLDDSPESVILESVIEGMAEYYSKNLSREVMKGMKENALKGISCGGTAPLGYDIDPETKKLVINQFEAQAVKLIFSRFLEGVGYSSIIRELNAAGYKTKKNNSFVKNSICDILRNEKYTGVFVYNRRQKADEFTGKRNNHSLKPDDEIIKIHDAFPAIIAREQFERVQNIFSARKRRYTHNSKEEYLLTGKLTCGVCGAAYVGKRIVKGVGKKYVYYGCSIKERAAGLRCRNTYINRDFLEDYVINLVREHVRHLDKRCVDDIYEQYICDVKIKLTEYKQACRSKLKNVESDINRIVDVITSVNSSALIEKLQDLENQKVALKKQILDIETASTNVKVSKSEFENTVKAAKKMLREKSIPKIKELIDLIVNKIIIEEECVKIYLNYCDLDNSKKKLIIANLNVCVNQHGDGSSAPRIWLETYGFEPFLFFGVNIWCR